MLSLKVSLRIRVFLILIGINGVAVAQAPPPEPETPDANALPPVPLIAQATGQANVMPGPSFEPAFANIGLYSVRDRGGTPRPAFAIGSARTASRYTNLHPDYLLPAPVDPNSMSANAAVGTTHVSSLIFSRSNDSMATAAPGGAPASTGDSPIFAVNYGLQVRPGVYYDTNYAGPGAFNPSLIPTGPFHQAGQLSFNGGSNGMLSVPLVADLGAQTIQSDSTGTISFQATGVNNGIDPIYARNAYARWVDPTETHGLVFGKAETLFGDQGAVPTSIMTGVLPIGAVAVSQQGVGAPNFTGVSQFRYSYFWHNVFSDQDHITASASVEDQSVAGSDVLVTTGGAVVNRYPTLVGRLRYSSPNNFDSYQIAGLMREIVYNDGSFNDHSATGWGVSANGRFALGENKDSDAIYLGSVAGQGIGGYIFGGTNSAIGFASPAQQFQLYNNYGAYAAYRRVWSYTSETEYLSSNFMYGYVYGTPGEYAYASSGPPPAMKPVASPDQSKNLNQFGCNLIWHTGDSSSFGLEYQYGTRLVTGGAHGDDHRIMFVLQLATGPSQTKASSPTTPSVLQSRTAPSGSQPTSRLSRLRL